MKRLLFILMSTKVFKIGAPLLIIAAIVYWIAKPAPVVGEEESYGLLIVVDGAKGDVWKRYAAEGRLPNIQRHFIDEGVWVDHATTVFPTITGAGLPAALTGMVPGNHGIPSLYFFDRKQRRYPVLYVALEAFDWNTWLSPEIKTVWEHFEGPNDTMAIGPALSRGADEVISFLWNLNYKPMEYRAKLQLGLRKLEREISGERPARLTVVYNGWFDHMEHGFGATAPEMDEHYTSIDKLVGEAIEVFNKTMDKREKQIGKPVRRYIALVSDHGHQDINEVYSIDKFVRTFHSAKVLDKSWTEVFGVKLKGDVPENFDDREIVMAAGEGHALLYFPTPVVGADGETIEKLDWDKRPGLQMLRNYPFRGKKVDVIQEGLQWKDAVSFMLGKDWDKGTVHIYSHNGESTIERQGDSPTRANYRYTVVQGVDPLGYKAHPAAAALIDGKFHHADDWQLATCETDAPDGPVMLYQAFDVEERAPDLYVSAAPFISIGDLVDGDKSASKHGGLTKDEAWSTVAFTGTGLSKGTIHTARNIDVVPTLLHLLNQPFDPNSIDGRILPTIQKMKADAGVPGG